MPIRLLCETRLGPQVLGHLVEYDSDPAASVLSQTERPQRLDYASVPGRVSILEVLARDRSHESTGRGNNDFVRSHTNLHCRARELVVAVGHSVCDGLSERPDRKPPQLVAPAPNDDKVKTQFVVDPCCRAIDLLGGGAFKCHPPIVLRPILLEAEHLNEALPELARSATHEEERSRLSLNPPTGLWDRRFGSGWPPGWCVWAGRWVSGRVEPGLGCCGGLVAFGVGLRCAGRCAPLR